MSSQVKYILSQVLSGSHIGLSPGGVSNLVLLKTKVSVPLQWHLTAFIHVVASQKAQFGAGIAQEHGLYLLLSLLAHAQCTRLGDTHDLGMAEPSHVCSCH